MTTSNYFPLSSGWEDRVKLKLSGTAICTLLLSVQHAYARNRSMLEEVPQKVLGYSAGAAVFCALQEGLRAARGRNDALNSLVAGAAAGALVAGHYRGPQFRLLGAALWGPLCGLAHVANDTLQPRILMEDLLISEGLLDPSILDRRQANAPSQRNQLYREAVQTSSMDDLVDQATRIRDREMHELFAATALQHAGKPQSWAAPAAAPSPAGSKGVPSSSSASTSTAAAHAAVTGTAARGGEGVGSSSDASPPRGARLGEVTRDDATATDEEVDEEDFLRWQAAARAAGGVPLVGEEEDGAWPAGSSRSADGRQADAAGKERSWTGWVKSFVVRQSKAA